MVKQPKDNTIGNSAWLRMIKDTGLKPGALSFLSIIPHTPGSLFRKDDPRGNAAISRIIALVLGSFIAAACIIGAAGLFIEHQTIWHVLGGVLLISVCYPLVVNARIAWKGM